MRAKKQASEREKKREKEREREHARYIALSENTRANSRKLRTCRFFFGRGLAAGHLILAEAGGVVTDMTGQRLDFGHGAKLLKNTGVVSVIIPLRMSEWY